MPIRHLLHITPSFAPGGAQVRTVLLMNHFGTRYRHTVLSLDSRLEASARIAWNVRADFAVVDKTTNPAAMILRLSKELRQRKPDLVLTYNWGSMDGTVAAALNGYKIVHTEDGFGPDEIESQKARRVWARRIVLRAASRVVAPSMCLANIMKSLWSVPERRIAFIPNGIDTVRYSPGTRRPGDRLVIERWAIYAAKRTWGSCFKQLRR